MLFLSPDESMAGPTNQPPIVLANQRISVGYFTLINPYENELGSRLVRAINNKNSKKSGVMEARQQPTQIEQLGYDPISYKHDHLARLPAIIKID